MNDIFKALEASHNSSIQTGGMKTIFSSLKAFMYCTVIVVSALEKTLSIDDSKVLVQASHSGDQITTNPLSDADLAPYLKKSTIMVSYKGFADEEITSTLRLQLSDLSRTKLTLEGQIDYNPDLNKQIQSAQSLMKIRDLDKVILSIAARSPIEETTQLTTTRLTSSAIRQLTESVDQAENYWRVGIDTQVKEYNRLFHNFNMKFNSDYANLLNICLKGIAERKTVFQEKLRNRDDTNELNGLIDFELANVKLLNKFFHYIMPKSTGSNIVLARNQDKLTQGTQRRTLQPTKEEKRLQIENDAKAIEHAKTAHVSTALADVEKLRSLNKTTYDNIDEYSKKSIEASHEEIDTRRKTLKFLNAFKKKYEKILDEINREPRIYVNVNRSLQQIVNEISDVICANLLNNKKKLADENKQLSSLMGEIVATPGTTQPQTEYHKNDPDSPLLTLLNDPKNSEYKTRFEKITKKIEELDKTDQALKQKKEEKLKIFFQTFISEEWKEIFGADSDPPTTVTTYDEFNRWLEESQHAEKKIEEWLKLQEASDQQGNTAPGLFQTFSYWGSVNTSDAIDDEKTFKTAEIMANATASKRLVNETYADLIYHREDEANDEGQSMIDADNARRDQDFANIRQSKTEFLQIMADLETHMGEHGGDLVTTIGLLGTQVSIYTDLDLSVMVDSEQIGVNIGYHKLENRIIIMDGVLKVLTHEIQGMRADFAEEEEINSQSEEWSFKMAGKGSVERERIKQYANLLWQKNNIETRMSGLVSIKTKIGEISMCKTDRTGMYVASACVLNGLQVLNHTMTGFSQLLDASSEPSEKDGILRFAKMNIFTSFWDVTKEGTDVMKNILTDASKQAFNLALISASEINLMLEKFMDIAWSNGVVIGTVCILVMFGFALIKHHEALETFGIAPYLKSISKSFAICASVVAATDLAFLGLFSDETLRNIASVVMTKKVETAILSLLNPQYDFLQARASDLGISILQCEGLFYIAAYGTIVTGVVVIGYSAIKGYWKKSSGANNRAITNSTPDVPLVANSTPRVGRHISHSLNAHILHEGDDEYMGGNKSKYSTSKKVKKNTNKNKKKNKTKKNRKTINKNKHKKINNSRHKKKVKTNKHRNTLKR